MPEFSEVHSMNGEVYEATVGRSEQAVSDALPRWLAFAGGEVDCISAQQVVFAGRVVERLRALDDDILALKLEGNLAGEQ
jgi:hypothetical protein